MVITKLKFPWRDRRLCMLIRMGKIKSTPEVRDIAKAVTFADIYGLTWRKMG